MGKKNPQSSSGTYSQLDSLCTPSIVSIVQGVLIDNDVISICEVEYFMVSDQRLELLLEFLT